MKFVEFRPKREDTGTFDGLTVDERNERESEMNVLQKPTNFQREWPLHQVSVFKHQAYAALFVLFLFRHNGRKNYDDVVKFVLIKLFEKRMVVELGRSTKPLIMQRKL